MYEHPLDLPIHVTTWPVVLVLIPIYDPTYDYIMCTQCRNSIINVNGNMQNDNSQTQNTSLMMTTHLDFKWCNKLHLWKSLASLAKSSLSTNQLPYCLLSLPCCCLFSAYIAMPPTSHWQQTHLSCYWMQALPAMIDVNITLMLSPLTLLIDCCFLLLQLNEQSWYTFDLM